MSAQAIKKQGQVAAESYNEVPYESFCYPMTHPDHLYTVGTFFGLTPPDFKTANVLEIGCAGGGNLLPLGLLFPKARFLGIDISKEQIALANTQKKDLGISNIDFQEQDILAFDMAAHKEKFDYIICHGIFSWVPEQVRARILKLIGQCLTPNGLAVVSYNTLPGWSVVRSFRDMMLYHTKSITSPREKIIQARALLDFLAETIPDHRSDYRNLIDEERKLLSKANDTYLYHDHLEAENAQFYFHDFADMAQTEGLTYVGDSLLRSMFLGNLPAKAQEKLSQLKDIISQEQYMDFVTNRRFRSTILCRNTQKINRNVDVEKIMDYYLTSEMKIETPNPDPAKDVTFVSHNGAKIVTHDIPTFTLFQEIGAGGSKPARVQDILQAAQKKLNLEKDDVLKMIMIRNGLQLLLRGFISIHSFTVESVRTVSDKPEAFKLARYQAQQAAAPMVNNVFRGSVETDSVAITVLRELDGTKTKDDLADVLVENVKKGFLTIAVDGKNITDPAILKVEARRGVDKVLQNLCNCDLLVS